MGPGIGEPELAEEATAMRGEPSEITCDVPRHRSAHGHPPGDVRRHAAQR